MEDTTIVLKITLLGEFNVGKTTLIHRLIGKNIDNVITTMSEYFIDYIDYHDKQISLLLTDTCGQERFRRMSIGFSTRADCILYVYDITNYESYKETQNLLYNNNNLNHVKILIGCKCDLDVKRQVGFQKAKNYSKTMGFDMFFEIDNINEIGIDILKDNMIKKILERRKNNPPKEDTDMMTVLNVSFSKEQVMALSKKKASKCNLM